MSRECVEKYAIINKMFDFLLKGQNKIFINQDFHHAKLLSKALLNLENNENKRVKKFYLEAIFLDISDRSSSHPIINFQTQEGSGLAKTIDNFLGSEGREIIWEIDPSFDLNTYFASNWFHQTLDTYLNEKKELTSSKEHYIEGKINFFNYFSKRLEVYDTCLPSDHIKYFKGVDRKQYSNQLRKIFEMVL